MKIKALKGDIFPALKTCADVAPVNPHSPSLAGGYFKAGENENEVVLCSTDLEVFCTMSFPAEITEPGEIAAPIKKLAMLVEHIDEDGSLNFSVEKEFHLRVRGGGTNTLLAGFNPENYPSPPQHEFCARLEIPAGKFAAAVRRIAYALPNDAGKSAPQGVLLEKAGSEVTMTCTDAYKLATESVGHAPEGPDFQVSLPLRACSLITKCLPKALSEEDVIKVEIGKGHCRFATGPAVVEARVFDDKKVDWRKIMPSDFVSTVKLSVAEALEAVERLAVVTDDKICSALVEVWPGHLIMRSNSHIGSAEEKLSAETTGSTAVRLKVPFLLQTLKAVGEGNVEISIPGESKPVLFKFDAAPEHLAILAPMIPELN